MRFPSTLFANAAHTSQNHCHGWPPSKHAHIKQIYEGSRHQVTNTSLLPKTWLIWCFHSISVSHQRSRSAPILWHPKIYHCHNFQITNNRLIRQVSHHPNQMLRSRFALQFCLVHITAWTTHNLVHPLILLPPLPPNNMGQWYRKIYAVYYAQLHSSSPVILRVLSYFLQILHSSSLKIDCIVKWLSSILNIYLVRRIQRTYVIYFNNLRQ